MTNERQIYLTRLLLTLATRHYQQTAYNYGEAVGHDARCKADVATAKRLEEEDIGLCPRTSAAETNARYADEKLKLQLRELGTANELLEFVHDVFAPYLVLPPKAESNEPHAPTTVP